MRITNQSIKFNLKDSKGNIVKTLTRKNRILNNYLDLMTSQAIDYSLQDLLNYDDTLIHYCYIKFDSTQTITDTSTTMNYDVAEAYEKDFLKTLLSKSTSGENSLSYEMFYRFTITALYDGSQIYGIGFGPKATAEGGFNAIDDYLVAFVDVEDFGITVNEDFVLEIIRIDTYETLGNLITGDYVEFPLHLGNPSVNYIVPDDYAEMDRVGFSYEVDGTNIDIWYDVSDLIITGISKGATIIGFDNFRINDGTTLYPATTLYPSTSLYPKTDISTQYKSVVFRYEVTNGNTGAVQGFYDYYYKIEDLAVSYDDTTMTITYKFQRESD